MVRLNKVSQFMNDNIIDNEHRRFNKTPVESDIIFHRTRSPTVAAADDLCLAIINTQLPGVSFGTGDDLLFGLIYVPISQHTLTFRYICGGDPETLIETLPRCFR